MIASAVRRSRNRVNLVRYQYSAFSVRSGLKMTPPTWVETALIA